MKKIIAQGKIEIPNALIEWKLQEGENGPEFTASGTVYENHRAVSFGQNLDEIFEGCKNPTTELIKIYTICNSLSLKRDYVALYSMDIKGLNH